MQSLFTVCVYGDFEKKDIRLKFFEHRRNSNCFVFQNTLIDAGYDAKLITVSSEDMPFATWRDINNEN